LLNDGSQLAANRFHLAANPLLKGMTVENLEFAGIGCLQPKAAVLTPGAKSICRPRGNGTTENRRLRGSKVINTPVFAETVVLNARRPSGSAVKLCAWVFWMRCSGGSGYTCQSAPSSSIRLEAAVNHIRPARSSTIERTAWLMPATGAGVLHNGGEYRATPSVEATQNTPLGSVAILAKDPATTPCRSTGGWRPALPALMENSASPSLIQMEPSAPGQPRRLEPPV
jgi:hypothetical protein